MGLIVRLKVAIGFIFIKRRNLNWERVITTLTWIAIPLDQSGRVVWLCKHVMTTVREILRINDKWA